MEHGTNHAYMDRNGELEVIKLLKNTSNEIIIIDGGANIGKYSQACLDILGNNITVYAFEPSNSTFQTLSQNLQGQNSVILNQLALSDKRQVLTLHYDKENSGLASVVDCNFEHYNLFLDKTETIQGIKLDDFCIENEISHINLLKLDLEGYDYFALLGVKNMIKNQQIDFIQFEMGRPNVDSKTFFKDFYYLLKDNYSLHRILSFGFVPLPEYSYEYEIFLGTNLLAVSKKKNIKI